MNLIRDPVTALQIGFFALLIIFSPLSVVFVKVR